MSGQPADLGTGGAQLWRALLTRDPSLMSSAMRDVAESACRTKDRLDALDEVVRREPMVLSDGTGRPRMHPAVTEARHQADTLKQLMAALRLPDATTGRRPQYRGPRGAYRVSVLSPRPPRRSNS